MPARHWIDQDASLIIADLSGDVTSAEILDYYLAVASDPTLRPGLAVLADARTVTGVPPFTELIALANAKPNAPPDLRPTCAAVVVSAGWLFGIIRQFAALAERGGIRVVPFYDIDEARAWLASDSRTTPASVRAVEEAGFPPEWST